MSNANIAAEQKQASGMLTPKQLFSKSANLLGFVVLVIFFEIVTGGVLLTGSNIELIVKQGFTLLICSLAAVFIMSTGNLDFSLGANIGFCCAVCAIVSKAYSPAAGIAAAVLVGALVGTVNGIVITKLKLPSFITCLCMMFILTAATQTVCAAYGGSISMPLAMRKWESIGLYATIGAIYFAVMLVMYRYTKFGKYMRALGVSKEASRQSGVGINKMILLGYLLSGAAAGFAGFLTMLRVGGASTTIGQTMTTDVIIAIVFGGMSVAGGATSKISAAILGTLIVSTLNNGMVLAGFGGDLQQLVKGVLFLVVIAISTNRDGNAIIK